MTAATLNRMSIPEHPEIKRNINFDPRQLNNYDKGFILTDSGDVIQHGNHEYTVEAVYKNQQVVVHLNGDNQLAFYWDDGKSVTYPVSQVTMDGGGNAFKSMQKADADYWLYAKHHNGITAGVVLLDWKPLARSFFHPNRDSFWEEHYRHDNRRFWSLILNARHLHGANRVLAMAALVDCWPGIDFHAEFPGIVTPVEEMADLETLLTSRIIR